MEEMKNRACGSKEIKSLYRNRVLQATEITDSCSSFSGKPIVTPLETDPSVLQTSSGRLFAVSKNGIH